MARTTGIFAGMRCSMYEVGTDAAIEMMSWSSSQLGLDLLHHLAQRLRLDTEQDDVGVLNRRAIVGRDLDAKLCGERVHSFRVIHGGDDVLRLGDVLAAKRLQQDAAHLAESEDGEARWLSG